MKEKLTNAMRVLEEMLEICLSSRQRNVDIFFFLLLAYFHESLHNIALLS